MSAKKGASLTGMIIALGIVYGDIGTSPLYVMNSIVGDQGSVTQTTPDFIIGVISLIFWTLMIITTIKYVMITMQADNKGEGGIFALYALVKKHAKWLVWPALIGGAALLADGTLTPAVTVTSATEGLKGQHFGSLVFTHSQWTILIVTTCILLALFYVQRFGISKIGKAFGPVMCLWFLFLAIAGLVNFLQCPEMLKALNPIYALKVLFSPENKVGIFILGSIFLATTGAEALYSDMGNVGKHNIYATWPLVYITLILNYLGQGAWMINHESDKALIGIKNINPFYAMLPSGVRPVAIAIATLAAIIASQALITGSYTLVDEAIGLKFLPHFIVKHPNNSSRKQMYIATVNRALCLITLFVVWFFRSSQKMEAAYGLAITVTMLMTTLLLYQFLETKMNKVLSFIVAFIFASIESVFLLASLVKFIHGGYVTLFIMLGILAVMVFWYFGNLRRNHYESASEYVSLKDYQPQLEKLAEDKSVNLYASNVVYLSRIKSNYQIKRSVMYSILDKGPKRAKVYWFVTINQTNAPYESNYSVDLMNSKHIVNVTLYLGFKKMPRISIYLSQILHDLIKEGYVDKQPQTYSTIKNRQTGDFKFVMINERPSDLSSDNNINNLDRMLIRGRLFLQNITASPSAFYGLQFSNTVSEASPLFMSVKYDQSFIQRGIYHPITSRKIKNIYTDTKD